MLIKKVFLVFVSVIITLGLLYAASYFYVKKVVSDLPEAPAQAEAFGDYSGYLTFSQRVSDALGYFGGTSLYDYTPYTAVELKPNFSFRFKNYDIVNNSLGFRSDTELAIPKPPGTFRVFILGGSTVEGSYNDEWRLSAHLQKDLKKTYPHVEVINAGVSGYSSDNELILLETKILDLQPDLVVVFDGVNDIYYSTSPAWQKRKDATYAQSKTLLDSLVNAPMPATVLSYVVKAGIQKVPTLTTLFRLLFRRIPTPVFLEEVHVNREGINTYLDNLRLIQAILEKKMIPGVLVFQPTLGSCKNNLSEYERTIVDYFKGIPTNQISEIGKVWREVGTSVKAEPSSSLVRRYDFSCIFQRSTETTYVDSVHYTPRGYEIIADEIAKLVVPILTTD